MRVAVVEMGKMDQISGICVMVTILGMLLTKCGKTRSFFVKLTDLAPVLDLVPSVRGLFFL